MNGTGRAPNETGAVPNASGRAGVDARPGGDRLPDAERSQVTGLVLAGGLGRRMSADGAGPVGFGSSSPPVVDTASPVTRSHARSGAYSK